MGASQRSLSQPSETLQVCTRTFSILRRRRLLPGRLLLHVYARSRKLQVCATTQMPRPVTIGVSRRDYYYYYIATYHFLAQLFKLLIDQDSL
jgi:hypothetical protein